MSRIFLFDIDGTLSKDGIIPESAKNALKLLRKKKELVFLATGRCPAQMKSLEGVFDVDGIIYSNGGYAELNHKELFSHSIPKAVMERLLSDGHHVSFLNKDHFATLENHPIFAEFTDHFHVKHPDIVDDSILDEDIYSLGVYMYHPEELDKARYPELDFVQVSSLGYDVIVHGVSKGNAVGELRSLFQGSSIVAFGDNYNDAEMLEASDIAIVMPKAPEEVLKLASFVTKDVFEDGIWFAVKEYLGYED